MAQRLGEKHGWLSAEMTDNLKSRLSARRFKKQIFLSVDIPAAVVGFGQGQELLLDAERGLVEALKELE
jgi:proteasome assembly chaperone 4